MRGSKLSSVSFMEEELCEDLDEEDEFLVEDVRGDELFLLGEFFWGEFFLGEFFLGEFFLSEVFGEFLGEFFWGEFLSGGGDDDDDDDDEDDFFFWLDDTSSFKTTTTSCALVVSSIMSSSTSNVLFIVFTFDKLIKITLLVIWIVPIQLINFIVVSSSGKSSKQLIDDDESVEDTSLAVFSPRPLFFADRRVILPVAGL